MDSEYFTMWTVEDIDGRQIGAISFDVWALRKRAKVLRAKLCRHRVEITDSEVERDYTTDEEGS